MQPIIAISVGELVNHDTGKQWTPVVYGQFHTYTEAVARAGGAPFIIPLVDDEATLRRLYDQCAGLLLSGGHDLYTADAPPPEADIQISPRRDRQELQLFRWALRDDKPVLGICRGMQLMNVALGGNLYQDIATELPAALDHQFNIAQRNQHRLAHRIDIVPGSRLAEILGAGPVATNSLHHQAVRKLGRGLTVTARAGDGVIEAVELPGKRFVLGVQSHPEALEAKAAPLWRRLFAAFVQAAASRPAPSRRPASSPAVR